MKQGVLPFQYEQEKSSPGMTAMAGMMTYLEVDARSRFEVVGRAPRGTAGVWSGLDGQPSGQLADTAEPWQAVSQWSIWMFWRRTRGCAGCFGKSRAMGWVVESVERWKSDGV